MNRNVCAGVAVFVVLLGCGEEDDKKGSKSSSSALCARICARSKAASCENERLDCAEECGELIDASPDGCQRQLNAFTNCAVRASFVCDADGEAQAPSCEALLDAWDACYSANTPPSNGSGDAGSAPVPVQSPDAGVPQSDAGSSLPGNPRPDAGSSLPGTSTPDAGTSLPTNSKPDAGTSLPGSDAGLPSNPALLCEVQASDQSCDICIKTSCCSVLTACGSACQALGNCIAECETQACANACYEASPAGAAQFDAIADCAVSQCEDECSDDPEPGAGTISDDCLPEGSVPDGICTSARFPVGHECVGGAPYADCTAVEGISDVYCCGH